MKEVQKETEGQITAETVIAVAVEARDTLTERKDGQEIIHLTDTVPEKKHPRKEVDTEKNLKASLKKKEKKMSKEKREKILTKKKNQEEKIAVAAPPAKEAEKVIKVKKKKREEEDTLHPLLQDQPAALVPLDLNLQGQDLINLLIL